MDIARPLVERYHYALGASKTAVAVHGLFLRGPFADVCAGVAWWLPPTRGAAETVYPGDGQKVLGLSRLVVVPWIPANACSFLLAHSVRFLDRDRWPCLLTYADTWAGHVGTIYKAANWEYMGETAAQRVYTLNGRLLSRKCGDRTRTHGEMLGLGCVFHGRHSKQKYRHVAP